MYLNKCQLIGNLTRDPETKALPSGSNVTSFSLATNRTWKDANGQKQEAVDFHNVVFFGKAGDIIAQYCQKGSQLYVEGRLTTRSWDGQDGKKNYRTEIVGEQFQFGNKPKDDRTGVYHKPESTDEFDETKEMPSNWDDRKTAKPKTMAKSTNPDYPSDDINPEDIPF